MRTDATVVRAMTPTATTHAQTPKRTHAGRPRKLADVTSWRFDDGGV
jgi:hypothetical protein